MLPRAKANIHIRLILVALLSTLVIYTLLPYNNPLILLLRWHTGNVKYYTKTAFSTHGRHAHPAGTFQVDVSDVGMIIKTGYATRDRLRAKLETLGEGWGVGNVVVAGDYEGEEMLGGEKVQVIDVLKELEDLDLGINGVEGGERRMDMYRTFRKAVKETPENIPEDVQKMGWELDIMKHIPALEHGLRSLPSKSWYLLTDDDSYTHTPSLLSTLSTLSPLKPHFIGNAIGSYTCRFAHGGSGIIFSSPALSLIFPSTQQLTRYQTPSSTAIKAATILRQAKIDSLSAPFGDRIVAELAMQYGIYVDEAYALHFNGESPRRTKISREGACVTLTGFHKLGVQEMESTESVFGSVRGVVRWWDVWGRFGEELVRSKSIVGFDLISEMRGNETRGDERGMQVDIRKSWDFVGVINDQHPRIETTDEKACMDLCRDQNGCLAWTWETSGKNCVLSDWFTVGYEREDVFSGVDGKRIGTLAERCENGG